MNMFSRNQYLFDLRPEYLQTKSKKKRSQLLDEAERVTRLNRKHLVIKLRPRSNLDGPLVKKKRRPEQYDGRVRAALVRCWQVFDFPCGQRLEPLLRTETEKLRRLKELDCSDETALKLRQMSSATVDRKLKRQKEIERVKSKYHRKIHPLLYQKIPIKVFGEQDRIRLGHLQIDLVEHCGQSAAGECLNTLSLTDIASGWWEGEAVMGRSQERTFQGLKEARTKFPSPWQEIHSDNGTEFINWHLLKYCERENLEFSRSRPYKKNDNCLVEQKNWTHVKKFVGYLRYDTAKEQAILSSLYRNELRLYKNFFQPVIKLISKERIGGRIHRRYDQPRTPYQRVIESKETPERTKAELRAVYESLNPAQLKRTIDDKLDMLYRAYQGKNKTSKVDINKRFSVRFSNPQLEPVSVR